MPTYLLTIVFCDNQAEEEGMLLSKESSSLGKTLESLNMIWLLLGRLRGLFMALSYPNPSALVMLENLGGRFPSMSLNKDGNILSVLDRSELVTKDKSDSVNAKSS